MAWCVAWKPTGLSHHAAPEEFTMDYGTSTIIVVLFCAVLLLSMSRL